MFTYDAVKDNPRLFKTMTSLTQEEFEKLLIPFQSAWESSSKVVFPSDQESQSQDGSGRKPALEKIADKLLFILYYVKVYPLQEILAFEFGMSQGQACYWIHLLSGVLEQALALLDQLPERHPGHLSDRLKKTGQKELGIDSTERRIQRPQDDEEQREYYSGKKKAHTVKNNLIATLKGRKVAYLSDTHEGKKHDKKICDEEQPTLPAGSTLYKDTGFQGYEPEGVQTVQPKKKPQGQELSAQDKKRNRLISKVRVIVEHVLSGVKRCRIVKDILRNTRAGFDDLVMAIACGLHNFRTMCRLKLKAAAT